MSINRMSDFTFKWTDVPGNYMKTSATDTKNKLDMRDIQIRDYLNSVIDVLNNEGASHLAAKDLNNISKSIQEILTYLLTGDRDKNENLVVLNEFKVATEKAIDLIDKAGKVNAETLLDLKNTFDVLVINAGESNAEIAAARYDNVSNTTYDKLGDRLDNVTEQLETIEGKMTYHINDFPRLQNEINDMFRIQRAIDYISQKGGGILKLGKEFYELDDTSIIMKPYVTLEGYSKFIGKDIRTGTTFNCYAMSSPQFLMCEYSSIIKCNFNYPNQVNEASNSPIQYNWTISTDSNKVCDDIRLEELFLVNSFKGINLDRAGRVNLKNIYGNPIKQGLFFDRIYDVISVDRVEFWTFAYNVGSNMYNYIQKNGVAFEFGRVDGGVINNMFAYGYNTTFLISGFTWLTFVGAIADKSLNPLIVNDSNNVEFFGGSLIGGQYNSTNVKINKISNTLKLKNVNIYGGNNIGIHNISDTGELIADNCFIKEVDDLIALPYVLQGNGKNSIITNSSKNGIFSNSNTFLNGVKLNCVEKVDIPITFSIEDNNSMITNIPNGYSIDLGKIKTTEQRVVFTKRIDNDTSITEGIYNFSVDINTKSSSPNSRMFIVIQKDDGSVVYNEILGKIPTSDCKINKLFYLGNKNYITQITILVSSYQVPVRIDDYITLSNIKLSKVTKSNYNLIDTLYNRTFNDNLNLGVNYTYR